MKKWYQREEALLDNKLGIRVGHVKVIRMMHERFRATPEEIAKHYSKNYRWHKKFIESVCSYKLWPEITPRGDKL